MTKLRGTRWNAKLEEHTINVPEMGSKPTWTLCTKLVGLMTSMQPTAKLFTRIDKTDNLWYPAVDSMVSYPSIR